MLVDPEILRAFADQVGIASNAIRAADAGSKASVAGDGLPGSTTQWACRVVGAHIAAEAEKIASSVTRMGAAVRGAGDKYEVTDGDLAGAFKGLF